MDPANHVNHVTRRFASSCLLAGAVLLGTPVVLTPSSAVAGPKAASTKIATIPVAGMTCGGCASNITAVLDDLEGVQKSSVDLKKAQAVVRFDPKRIEIDAILEAIKSIGYEPGKPTVKDA